MGDNFYCRYYVGHKGKFGHEFMEFEITSDGRLRYSNNSNYKNDTMIRKEGVCWALYNVYLFLIMQLTTKISFSC